MIDYSQLTNDKPGKYPYDTEELTSQDYKHLWSLDIENPNLDEVLSAYKERGVDYRVIEFSERKRDIWAKGPGI